MRLTAPQPMVTVTSCGSALPPRPMGSMTTRLTTTERTDDSGTASVDVVT
jgi:hypothetical protein